MTARLPDRSDLERAAVDLEPFKDPVDLTVGERGGRLVTVRGAPDVPRSDAEVDLHVIQGSGPVAVGSPPLTLGEKA